MNLGSAFRNIALEIYIKFHTVVHPALLYYFVLVYLLDLPSLRQLCWFTLAFCIFAHKKGAICQRESSFVISVGWRMYGIKMIATKEFRGSLDRPWNRTYIRTVAG